MSGNIRSVTVETISSHQLRPYGDHVHESYLTFSVPKGQMWASKFGTTEDVVKQYIPLFVHSFTEDTEDSQANWYESRLKKLEQVSPGRWHVIVTTPYTD